MDRSRTKCSVEKCNNSTRLKRGLCDTHYNSFRRLSIKEGTWSPHKKIIECKHCKVKSHEAKGFCNTCYARWLRTGNVEKLPRGHPVGTKHLRGDGYIDIKIDEVKWQVEHRCIMEQKLGRTLISTESVHHINGNRADNREENLELWITFQPYGQRVEDLVSYAKEILERYDAQ